MSGAWSDIKTALEAHGSCAIVTVVELFGSGPREIGARLIVAPDGSFRGTIGGGALEWQALAAAQALLPADTASLTERKFGLGPDLGQCCGGYVTLAFETLQSADLVFARRAAEVASRGPIWVRSRVANGKIVREIVTVEETAGPCAAYETGRVLTMKFGTTLTPVYVFGAGHVGRALVNILKTLPIRAVWVDSRDFEIDPAYADNIEFRSPRDPAAEIEGIPDDAYVFVMSHSHALDLDICLKALRADQVSYVGVIGSKTKKARFDKRLRDAGLSDRQMARFHCPLGLGAIGGKAPAVIAVSIAADLIQRIETAAAHETTPKSASTIKEHLRESG